MCGRCLASCAPVTAYTDSSDRNWCQTVGVTLRHSAVQRLVDADFPLKTIGDFIGHRSARSTEVYAKVAVEALRQVALGDGEEVPS